MAAVRYQRGVASAWCFTAGTYLIYSESRIYHLPSPQNELTCILPPNGTYNCFSLGSHGGRGANEGIDIIYKVQKKAFFPSFSGQWRWWSSCGLALQPEGLGWDPGCASMACKAQTPDSVSPMRISALFPHTLGTRSVSETGRCQEPQPLVWGALPAQSGGY